MKSPVPTLDPALYPRDAVTGEPLEPRRQPGYYVGFSTLAQRSFWDAATRRVVDTRVNLPPPRRFFSESEWAFWTSVFDHLIPQTDRTVDRQIPLVAMLDERLHFNRTVGYRYENMPHDRIVYKLGIEAINEESKNRYAGDFLVLPYKQQELVLQAIHDGKPQAAPEIWKTMSVDRFWQAIMGDAVDAYYAHPWAWDEIGFGGPAYPRAYTRLERGEPEPWEVEEQRYHWLPPAMSLSGQVEDATPDHTEAVQHKQHSSKGSA